jgi:transposase-like protein
LRDLIEGRLVSADARSELIRLATQLIAEEALEAEQRDALGREYYEHGAAPGRGYRNGTRKARLKTAEGIVEYAVPQVAGREEPYRSVIAGQLRGRTEQLEDLAVELLARGLSVRDIEDAFRDEMGRLLLSRTAVSELGERLWADYQDFIQRDLGEHDIAYLFVDGIAERLRPGQRREPVLAAWGFTTEGRKVLLHLMPGSKEDTETVSAFFQDMRARGLGDPLLVTSDGAPGIIKAIDTCFPRTARQRCLAHRLRNLAAKVPEDLWPEFKARVLACYQAPSRAIARELAAGVVADYEKELPSAVACFKDDFEACIAHLMMPVGHRRAIRTTNLLERLFLEERRRLEIIRRRLRREGRPQAHVRRHDPRRRALAKHQGHRIRTPTNADCQERARRTLRGRERPQQTGLKGDASIQIIQQVSDLTASWPGARFSVVGLETHPYPLLWETTLE